MLLRDEHGEPIQPPKLAAEAPAAHGPKDIPLAPNLSVGRERAYRVPDAAPETIPAVVTVVNLWGRIVKFFTPPTSPDGQPLREVERIPRDHPDFPENWSDEFEQFMYENRFKVKSDKQHVWMEE